MVRYDTSTNYFMDTPVFSDYFYQCGQVRKMAEDVLAMRMGRQARHQEEACQQDLGEEVFISKKHCINS